MDLLQLYHWMRRKMKYKVDNVYRHGHIPKLGADARCFLLSSGHWVTTWPPPPAPPPAPPSQTAGLVWASNSLFTSAGPRYKTFELRASRWNSMRDALVPSLDLDWIQFQEYEYSARDTWHVTPRAGVTPPLDVTSWPLLQCGCGVATLVTLTFPCLMSSNGHFHPFI